VSALSQLDSLFGGTSFERKRSAGRNRPEDKVQQGGKDTEKGAADKPIGAGDKQGGDNHQKAARQKRRRSRAKGLGGE